MLKQFLKNDGDNIIFTGNYLEMYIPYSYFEGKLAESYGSSIRTFGLFSIRVFDDSNKPMAIETLNLPTMIDIFPSSTETKDLSIIPDSNEVDKYVIAKFYRGNKVMKSNITKDSTNVELFVDIVCRGKLPKSIPYTKLIDVWHKNITLNGLSLGVPSKIFEIILTETYRNPNKPEETFAKVIGKNPNVSEYAYMTANIREICARNSTFAAITFEDMDAMLTSSLNISKYDKKQTISPIEKIIKM